MPKFTKFSFIFDDQKKDDFYHINLIDIVCVKPSGGHEFQSRKR